MENGNILNCDFDLSHEPQKGFSICYFTPSLLLISGSSICQPQSWRSLALEENEMMMKSNDA